VCKLLYRPIFVGPFGARWAPSGPSGPPAFAGAAADKLRHWGCGLGLEGHRIVLELWPC